MKWIQIRYQHNNAYSTDSGSTALSLKNALFVHRILKSLLLTPEDVFSVNTFDELQLDARMVKNLADLAITQLTTIQARALPVILGGKDALVKSQTGSGKTLTYAVPIMQVIVVLFLLPVLRIRDPVPFLPLDPGSGMEKIGSGLNIPDPDFYPFRIPDLRYRIPDSKTATKE